MPAAQAAATDVGSQGIAQAAASADAAAAEADR